MTFYANKPGSDCVRIYKSRYIIEKIDSGHVNNRIRFADTVSQIWGTHGDENIFSYRFLDIYQNLEWHIWAGAGGHFAKFSAEEYNMPLPAVFSEYESCDSSDYNIWDDMVLQD